MQKLIKKLNLTEEVFKDIINRFEFKKDACAALNIQLYQLNKLLKYFKIDYPKVSHFIDKASKIFDTYSEIDKNWLINNWVKSSKSLPKLAEEFNVSLSLLDSRVQYYGLSKRFKYQVSDKLFDYNDPHVAYLAGLIATDGYIPKNKLAVELDLTGSSEYSLLCSIKDYFEITAPIVKYGNSYRLRIAANNLVSFLEDKYQLVCINKTFEVDVPRNFSSECCAKNYVRGCLDGDGSVYPKRYQFSICNASEKLIEGLARIIELYTGQHLNMHTREGLNSNYYHIGTTDKKARIILSWIYDDSEDMFKLDRKYEKFKMNELS